jgi:hypothetical protein
LAERGHRLPEGDQRTVLDERAPDQTGTMRSFRKTIEAEVPLPGVLSIRNSAPFASASA